jgi:glycosyltransferase involved in cell wall biosynthesis
VPKVSILIPTYNRVAYLRDALAHARAQTLDDIEIVVSDDGSTDGTDRLLVEQATADPRIRVAPRNPTRGLFENVNHLLTLVRGEAFCILGDDDRLAPTFGQRLYEVLARKSSVVAAFCDHDLIDERGLRLIAQSVANSLHFGRKDLAEGIVQRPELVAVRMSMCMGFSLYRSSSFAGERFALECGGAADVDMALRAAMKGPIFYIADALGSYRVHANTATRTRRLFMSEGLVTALSRHVLRDPEAEAVRRGALQTARLRLLPDLSIVDRARFGRLLLDYARDGGTLINSRVAAAGVLACLPRRAATWAWSRAIDR